MRKPVTPVALLKAIHCYNYQACETPDWETTKAYSITRELESKTIRQLPGYEQAEWSIDD